MIFFRLRFGDLPNTIDGLDVAVIDNVALWEIANATGVQAEAVHSEWLESVAAVPTARISDVVISVGWGVS